jgi:hypothetical protein
LASRNASIVFGAQVLRSTHVTIAESYWYAPYNLLTLSTPAFLGSGAEAQLIGDDVGISGRRYSTFATTGAIVQSFRAQARTSFELDYNYSRTENSVVSSSYETHRAGGTMRHRVSTNLSWHLGYHYRRTDYPSFVERRRFDAHEANAGIDFTRPLSLTRRTQVSFSTGSAAFANQSRTHYRAFGDARLTHEIGRTWSAAVVYSRGIGFVDTFDRPILYDSVTTGLAGLLMRRLQFSASLRASDGSIGETGRDNDYRTYMGSANLTMSLNRSIGLGTTYYYLRYRFGSGAALPIGVVRDGERQGVQVFATAWFPIFYRARKP